MQHTPHHDLLGATSRTAGGTLTCLTAAHWSPRSHAGQDWAQGQHAQPRGGAEHVQPADAC